METTMENIRKEVATENPEGIFSKSTAIYRDILNKDLKAGLDITLRFDWCNENKFVVNYMASDLPVEDYTNYRKLSKDEFVEKLMAETKAFTMGKQNSVLDIHFAIGENHDLYYMYSDVKTPTNKVMASHNKNCKEGFLVYTPSQHGIATDLSPTNNDSIGANVNTEDLTDEPEDEAVEEEKEDDVGIPDTKLPAQMEHENAVDKLMEEEKKKQDAKMNENNLIVRKIDDVIGELEKIEKRDDRNNQQFSKVSRKYEEMMTYIDEYINNDLIKYETDFDKNTDLQGRYADLKKKWELYFEWRLQNQYSFLTEKLLDNVKFLRKRDEFISMLKELRNYINVNLFGKPAIQGGKTKRRYRAPFQVASILFSLKNRRIAKQGFANVERRKKTIRKRMSKKQTKKFRRIG
jgi:hypothetical protein